MKGRVVRSGEVVGEGAGLAVSGGVEPSGAVDDVGVEAPELGLGDGGFDTQATTSIEERAAVVAALKRRYIGPTT